MLAFRIVEFIRWHTTQMSNKFDDTNNLRFS